MVELQLQATQPNYQLPLVLTVTQASLLLPLDSLLTTPLLLTHPPATPLQAH
jgi:hypothetical protein